MHHLSVLCEPLPLTPRIPGKTFGAGKDLTFLHSQSCKQYIPWVAHNAKAALRTRDEMGRFGAWWRANDTVEIDSLPQGAIDYRNNAAVLFTEPWTEDSGLYTDSRINRDAADLFRTAKESSSTFVDGRLFASQSSDGLTSDGDLNDRGRGRTVETQSGGVAVLRALWELQDNMK